MRRCGSYPVLHSASANEAGLGTRGKKNQDCISKGWRWTWGRAWYIDCSAESTGLRLWLRQYILNFLTYHDRSFYFLDLTPIRLWNDHLWANYFVYEVTLTSVIGERERWSPTWKCPMCIRFGDFPRAVFWIKGLPSTFVSHAPHTTQRRGSEW